jgi:hypothetical protein
VTAGPLATPSPSPAATAAPGPGLLSGSGHDVFGPVPLRSGGMLVLYPAAPLRRSYWQVYRVDQRLIAVLDLDGQAIPAWSTTGIAPGLYFIRLTADYLDGTQAVSTHKIVVLP